MIRPPKLPELGYSRSFEALFLLLLDKIFIVDIFFIFFSATPLVKALMFNEPQGNAVQMIPVADKAPKAKGLHFGPYSQVVTHIP